MEFNLDTSFMYLDNLCVIFYWKRSGSQDLFVLATFKEFGPNSYYNFI
jgi:hypothetical protein